jgi:hypothetical protein
VRGENDATDLSEGRQGFDIAVAKALHLSRIVGGTTKSRALTLQSSD